MLQFRDPVSFLKGAMPAVRKAWAELGILTIEDLLRTIPRRYEDFSQMKPLFEAKEGEMITARVRVKTCQQLPGFRRHIKMMRLLVEDASGTASATFFNQPWLAKELVPGREIFLSGTIGVHPRFGRQMSKPQWEPVEGERLISGSIAPVYALSGSLAQKTYRRLVKLALSELESPEELIDEALRKKLGLLGIEEAIHQVHAPKTLALAEEARRRFAFEEVLAYRLAFGLANAQARAGNGWMIPLQDAFAKRFVQHLPFPLTDDQKRAVWAMMQDLAQSVPMRRLLQGDVGSGKTVVAAFLAAHVQRFGASVAFLVPTDLLAQQHASTLRRLFLPHLVPLLLLTRTTRRLFFGETETALTGVEAERRIQEGNLVVLGTHALLQERRLPPDLALAIVDEQHRFGVQQRQFLADGLLTNGRTPHLLSMTATPIPRSLALTIFGDLAVSSIKQKPSGRLPVATHVCAGSARETAYAAIRAAAARKEASFVVCPLIETSDVLGVAAATEEFTRLQAGPLAGLRLGLLHGRLKAQEKETVMQALVNGELDVLVATSVIEVGVDVPKATVIAIEGAERFGLAQLHQMRGRVGRSSLPSQCFLLTDAQGEGIARLERVAVLTDGFALAEEDFHRRGSGNLLGTLQSGHLGFRSVRLTDVDLMQAARDEAHRLLEEDPTLKTQPAWQERIRVLKANAHLE